MSAQSITVVMLVGAIQASAQLHGRVVVGVGHTLHAQQRRGHGHVEQLGLLGIWADRTDVFVGPDHAHAELSFEQRVHRTVVIT